MARSYVEDDYQDHLPNGLVILFDLAMAEMRRRRPELREKTKSEVIAILQREYHWMPASESGSKPRVLQ